ncbi:hypothetical protein [Stutzerimonas stutzeri]|uniref:Uncharacterized protein n=1 Tax=Stutzerimonas stutzeri TaxID=316 RepID=A0AA42PCD7_STUST|nr:hypothetical protein [Stutzerimonas stutzeri]MDH1236524.1 hypothetical protein [Stutzerimonas stutzeri]
MTTLEKLQMHLISPAVHQLLPGHFEKDAAPPVRCADGTTMSVQASADHASCPRENYGPYTQVEVWLCGEVPAWAEYGDGDDLYEYLPIELVVEEIDRRGGFAE